MKFKGTVAEATVPHSYWESVVVTVVVVIPVILEGRNGTAVATITAHIIEALGDADSDQTRTVVVLVVDRLAVQVAATSGSVGAVGIGEGTILNVEDTSDHTSQIDTNADDAAIAALVGIVDQDDSLLAGDGSTIIAHLRSELITEALELLAELVDVRGDNQLAAVGLGVVDQMLGILLQPDAGSRNRAGLIAGIDGDHTDFTAAQELIGDLQHILLHIAGLDVPGTLTGDQVQDVVHDRCLAQSGHVSLNCFGDICVLDVIVCHN